MRERGSKGRESEIHKEIKRREREGKRSVLGYEKGLKYTN